MKKNIILLFSILLILIMCISMFYVALTSSNQNAINGNNDAKTDVVEQNLRMNISVEPPQLHPNLATDPISKSVLLQTFEGLTSIDPWGQTVNAMAKVIKISDDNKTYLFTIRDAKWSNGDPVTAHDFEYAWKWALDPANNSANANQLFYLEGAQIFNEGKGNANEVGVKAINEKLLEIKIVNPTPFFLELLATPAYFPINSKVAKENPKWASESTNYYTSNGPFKLTKWSHGEKIILKKNDHYWDASTVRLETITMQIVNNSITGLSMLYNDELDWVGSPTGNLPLSVELLEEDPFQKKSVTGVYSYKFNTTVEPFNNENIRKAFALAINRQQLVDSAGQNGLVPAMSMVPPNLSLHNNGFFKDNDVIKAKQYLQKGIEELGYKDVSELPHITLSRFTTEEDNDIDQAIQKMWKEHLGVEVTIQNTELKEHIQNIQTLNYQVAQNLWVGDVNDPMNFLEMFLKADFQNNGTGWESEKFQTLIEKSKKGIDVIHRQELLKGAEGELINDMPVVPIYFYSYNWVQARNVVNPDVSGLGHIKLKWSYFQ